MRAELFRKKLHAALKCSAGMRAGAQGAAHLVGAEVQGQSHGALQHGDYSIRARVAAAVGVWFCAHSGCELVGGGVLGSCRHAQAVTAGLGPEWTATGCCVTFLSRIFYYTRSKSLISAVLTSTYNGVLEVPDLRS